MMVIIILSHFQSALSAKTHSQTYTNAIDTNYYSNSIFAGDYPDPSHLRDGDNFSIVAEKEKSPPLTCVNLEYIFQCIVIH
jgi:hypothetical protein